MLKHLTILLPTAIAPLAAFAGTFAITPEPAIEPSAYDKIWGLATWYNNKENPVIQKFAFTGRAQIDFFHVDNDLGRDDDWNFRRLRLGFKANMFQHMTVHVEADADDTATNLDDVYNKLTDAYIAWEFDPMCKLTIGKQSIPFTLDGATSSKELIAIDRSNIANNIWFPEEYLPGLSVSGDNKEWNYRLGVYSSGTANAEFGDFDGGYIILASLGKKFAGALGSATFKVRADYVYQEPTDVATFTRPNENIGALSAQWQKGAFTLASGISASTGYGSQGDLFGFEVMPSYFLIKDKLQAVARYTYLSSSKPTGVRYARYDTEVTGLRGDEYQELYTGLNYYFYGHKLKIQGGVQYDSMNDTSAGDIGSWQATLGLRISW